MTDLQNAKLHSPGLFTGPGSGGAHRVAEFVRILAVTNHHDPTSYEVGYERMNNPGL